MQRQTVNVDVFAQHIACGAGYFGDDRRLAPGEAVQQTGLAGVGFPGDHHTHPFSQQVALPGAVQHYSNLATQLIETRRHAAVGEKIHLIVGKIYRSLDITPERDDLFDQGVNPRRELALQRAQRGLCGLFRATCDKIGDGLGLGEIQLVIQEGAFGKFSRPRMAAAEFDHALDQHIHNHRAAVTLQFQNILARERVRRGKVQRNAVVYRPAISVIKCAHTRMAWSGKSTENVLRNLPRKWTGDAYDADPASSWRCCRGDDSVS